MNSSVGPFVHRAPESVTGVLRRLGSLVLFCGVALTVGCGEGDTTNKSDASSAKPAKTAASAADWPWRRKLYCAPRSTANAAKPNTMVFANNC